MTGQQQPFDEANLGRHEAPSPRAEPRELARQVAARRSALWAAYGDALGWISELTDEAGLRRRTRGEPLETPISWRRQVGGRAGVSVLLPAGCYSDDTQLRLATSRAIGPNGFDVEAFSKVELPVWLAYALGAGRSTRAAASNLAKPKTSWFLNSYRGWFHSGGNGAAMRIQPHLWAAPRLDDPPSWMLDVVRNSICTHAHPAGLIGAVLHALALASTISRGVIPDTQELVRLAETARDVPAMLATDPEVGQYWLTDWERYSQRTFFQVWTRTVEDTINAIELAANAATLDGGSQGYQAVIDALNLRDPGCRGSGQLTSIAAVALTWCEQRPAYAMTLAANAIGTDTDTIATMAGALLGTISGEDPPGEILDRDLITTEAHRLGALAKGDSVAAGHRYPDLLNWSAPQTQADALAATAKGQLHVLGLGPVSHSKSESLPAAQGDFCWQWVELAIGQTLLIKRRNQLSTVHHADHTTGDNELTTEYGDQKTSRRTSVTDLYLTQRGMDQTPAQPPNGRTSESDTGSHKPLDIDRAIAYLRRAHFDDEAVGYTIRRVAREGTPEQLAAFLAVLVDLLRR